MLTFQYAQLVTLAVNRKDEDARPVRYEKNTPLGESFLRPSGAIGLCISYLLIVCGCIHSDNCDRAARCDPPFLAFDR